MSKTAQILLIAGAVLLTIGVGAIYWPAGVIVAGCLCVLLSVGETRANAPSGDPE